MHHRSLSFVVVSDLVGLTACSEGGSSADVKQPFTTSALVFDGVAVGPADQWYGHFAIDNAPAGEYLLFASTVRPTSTAGLAAFDPSSCGLTCSVDGLGDYMGRSTSSDVGKVVLSGPELQRMNAEQFFVIARRATAPAGSTMAAFTTLTVTGTISVSDPSGGCGTPKPPTITASDL